MGFGGTKLMEGINWVHIEKQSWSDHSTMFVDMNLEEFIVSDCQTREIDHSQSAAAPSRFRMTLYDVSILKRLL